MIYYVSWIVKLLIKNQCGILYRLKNSMYLKKHNLISPINLRINSKHELELKNQMKKSKIIKKNFGSEDTSIRMAFYCGPVDV